MIGLKIKKREIKENLENLRGKGTIPAVFYGPKEKSTPISISGVEFKKVLKEAGESTVISLTGEGEDKEALIHDIDLDPVTDAVRHVDFYVIEKGKMVEVSVPLVYEGVAPAIKELGGVLVKVLHEVEIEAKPADLPHELIVDVSKLNDFEKQILAKDISMPSGVNLITDPEEVVALVAKPKEEKEEEAGPIDLSAIEVEKKGKTEEEGAEGAEGASAPEKK